MPSSATLYEWTLATTGISSPAVDADSRAIPITRDIAYDHETKKFVRVAGGLTLTTGQESVRQAVEIALRTFLGEVFTDTTKGVPYFESILVKSPNLVAIKAELTAQIRTVAGVRSVTSLNASFDKSTRALSVTWTADTEFGTIEGSTPFSV